MSDESKHKVDGLVTIKESELKDMRDKIIKLEDVVIRTMAAMREKNSIGIMGDEYQNLKKVIEGMPYLIDKGRITQVFLEGK